jgi:predicted thioesterase
VDNYTKEAEFNQMITCFLRQIDRRQAKFQCDQFKSNEKTTKGWHNRQLHQLINHLLDQTTSLSTEISYYHMMGHIFGHFLGLLFKATTKVLAGMSITTNDFTKDNTETRLG